MAIKRTRHPNKAKPNTRNVNARKKRAAVSHRSKPRARAARRMPAERPRPRHSIAKPVAKPATNTRNAEGRKKRTNVNIMPPEETKRAIDKLLSNEKAVEYLKRNVSKAAIDVVCTLVTPKTDEQLVEQLGMKINAIRRILNIMQGYGITNYYISKNTKGWLSFAWYINTGKLRPFLDYVANTESEKTITNSNCNDYFLCDNCYKTDKLLYTFDAAFESSFRCPCGKSLARMDKEEAETIINTNSAI